MTKEQAPDISDNELRDYIIVEHESKQLYAIDDTPTIPKEYREF
jgi:hypothetical protein